MILDAISDQEEFFRGGKITPSFKTSGIYFFEFIYDTFSGKYSYFGESKSLYEVFRKIIDNPKLLDLFNPFFLFCVKMSVVFLFLISFYYVSRNFNIRRNPIIHYISLGIISYRFVHSGAFIAFMKETFFTDGLIEWLFSSYLFWPLRTFLSLEFVSSRLNMMLSSEFVSWRLNVVCFVALFFILYHIYNCLMIFFESRCPSDSKRTETRNEKVTVEVE